jgi:hypothetical protein
MYRKLMILILATGWTLFVTACASSQLTASPTATPEPDSQQGTVPAPTVSANLPAESPPRGAVSEFKTDFSKHNVPYSEILSGGPPKDGIPPLDNPNFQSVSEADEWLEDREPVVFVQVGDDARAYPIRILMWHEIVNDTVGDEPLVVSFCPLCNTAISFKRTFNPSTGSGQGGQVLDFGTTGRLRYSNLIMYDRQTETWWQQATGDAIAGEYTGAQLEFYPASIISWSDFKSQYPDGKVLSRETGFARDYGKNPYFGYDDINQSPFLFDGETPDQLPPMARVLTVDSSNEAIAYPYDVLEEVKVINDSVGGVDVVVLWAEGTSSALDADNIPAGREVGAAVAYSRVLDTQTLTFKFSNGKFLDEQTGSEWNILGQAVVGELKGRQLSQVVSINHFWFSWAAFRPETKVYQP